MENDISFFSLLLFLFIYPFTFFFLLSFLSLINKSVDYLFKLLFFGGRGACLGDADKDNILQ